MPGFVPKPAAPGTGPDVLTVQHSAAPSSLSGNKPMSECGVTRSLPSIVMAYNVRGELPATAGATPFMSFFPLRIPPGADLRKTLEDCLQAQAQVAAFVLSGIGSLDQARIRYAGHQDEATIAGPLELLSLAGSIVSEGAHLHMSASSSCGQVLGGHVCYGNTIRTTAEILLVFLTGWQLSREYDSRTGYRELVARTAS